MQEIFPEMRLMHRLLQWLSCLSFKRNLLVFIYHQVLDETDLMRIGEPERREFLWQMDLIKKFYQPMSISSALEAIERGSLPRNAVCVTFDDGYLNNLTIAAPILKEMGIPATVYVATGFSDGKNMFNDRIIDLIGDESRSRVDLTELGWGTETVSGVESRIELYMRVIKAVKYLPPDERTSVVDRIYRDNNAQEYPRRMMTQSEIVELASMGIDIGAHTVDHPILSVLSPKEQLSQITESKQQLEKLIGKSVDNFAYPNGKQGDDYTAETLRLVKKAGFKTAVTTEPGVSSAATDRFQLKRFTPWDKSPLKFHLRLLLTALKG